MIKAMQKKLMMIVILLLALSNRMAADDNVSISDFNIFKGQSKEVSITLTNATDYAGFQFDLELPEGITVKTKATGGYEFSTTNRIPDGTDVSMSLTDGVYRFVAIPLGTSITNFTGNSGEAIINLTIQADENATEGAFTGSVKNIKLSNAAGTNSSDTFEDQPFTATIRGDEPYAVLSDENKTLTFYYDKEKDFRTGAVSIEIGWNSYKESITSVVFDNSFAGCTSLTSTSSWFSQCTNLTSITGISNLKTDNVTSMRFMFNGCSNLTTLDLSNLNTANVTDMGWMFKDCSSLTSIEYDANKFVTQNVTDMGLMFEGCSSLTAINVSHFNTEKVTNMGQMFRNCSSLTSLDVRNFNTDQVENMHSMFNGCSSLTSLDVSRFNTTNVTDIASMFSGCSSLTSLDVSNFSVSNITALSSMFNGCELLTSIDISGFNTSTVTEMNFMFYNCSALKTIYVGDGWSTDVVTSSANMFTYCEDLIGGKGTTYNDQYRDATYGRIDGGPNSETPGYLTNIADKGKNFPYAVLSDDNTTLTFYYNGDRDNYNWMKVGETSDLSDKDWLGDAYATSITSVVFDESFVGYTELSSTAFWFFGLSNLETITGLNYLNTGNVTNMNSMFRGCQSLTTLDLSSLNTAKVTDMGSMFANCSGLSTLTLSGSFDTGLVVYMNEMFENCTSLTELDLSRFNIAKVENMNSMFYNASNLKTIYVGTGWSTTLETAGSNMFSGCTSLVGGSNTEYDENIIDFTYARIDGGPYSETPGYYTDIANKGKEVYMVLTDGNSKLTFYYDANKATRSGTVVDLFGTSGYGWSSYKEYITSVEFDPSFVDYHGLTSTKEWFMSCNNIESITGISYLNTENVTDMTSMFQYCSALTELDLGSLNTSNVTKMTHMFYDCQNLVSLNISGFNTAKVTGMEAMFYNCNKLTSLNLSSFVTENVTNMQELFWSCLSLTDINVTGFNTDLVTSMAQMFYGCSGLTTLDLSSFNTVNATEMTGMFQGCSNLVTIYVGENWSAAQAATGGNAMFEGCTSIVGGSGTVYYTSGVDNDWRLAHIDEGTTNPGYLTDIADKGKVNEPYAVLSDNDDDVTTDEGTVKGKTLTFYYDKKMSERSGMSVGPYTILTSEERGWDENVESITTVVFDDSFVNCNTLSSTAAWFFGCSNLKNIENVGNLRTDNVKNMSAMFSGCYSLTNLDLSNFKTNNVTDMSFMFNGCFGFTNLDLVNFSTENLTTMHWMFFGCSELTSLDLSSFDTNKVTDMTEMFNGCKKLSSIYVSNKWTNSAVTESRLMFFGCTNLVGGNGTLYDYNSTDFTFAHIDGGADNPGYFTDIADKGKANEPYAVLSEENSKLTFYYDKLKDDRGGMSVGVFSDKSERSWDDVINMVTTVAFDASFAGYYPTSTACWFWDFNALTTFEGLENLKTENVTDMHNMFTRCFSLTSLDLSSFNTENVENMYEMFSECSGLQSLDFSMLNTGKVKDMSHMFWGTDALSSINFGGTFSTSSVITMEGMFDACIALEILDLSRFNTANVLNMSGMFFNCNNLKAVYVSNLWSTENVENSDGVFAECHSLRGFHGTSYSKEREAGADFNGIRYAHIDEGISNPGYFTDIADKDRDYPYALIRNENTTLEFYYDKNKIALGGMDIGPFENSTYREWDDYKETITTVVFDESFSSCSTLISTSKWFDGFSNLTTITGISNLNTNNVTDMSGMFANCSKLEDLDLSGLNSAKVTNMSYMFSGCSSLKTIYVGNDWSTAVVTDGTEMFLNCNALVGGFGTTFDAAHIDYTYARIDGGTANPGYLTDVISTEPYAVLSDENKTLTFYYDKKKEDRDGMSVGPFTASNERGWYSASSTIETVVFDESFANCTTITSTAYWFDSFGQLTTISNINRLNTENVTSMERMFMACGKLESLDLSSFNTANVTDMSEMFSDCTKLTSLDVSSFNTAKVTDMERMFRLLQHVESLDLSSFNTAAVTNMNSMFYDCNALKTILVSVDGWSTAALTDSENMFANCLVLVGDQGTSYNEDNPKDKTYAHIDGGTANPGYLTDVRSMEPYVVLSDGNKTLTFYYDKEKEYRNGIYLYELATLDNKDHITKAVFDNTFANCTSLTSTGYWFAGCYNLTSIEGLDNLKTDHVESMTYMFYMCRALTDINVSHFNTANVTDMSNMFNDCGVASLDVSNFNTANVTNMAAMFMNCGSLTSLDLSNFDTGNVENMQSMFNGCYGLTSLNLDRFKTTKVTNMECMFLDCQKLTSLNLSSFNTSNVTNMYNMFSLSSELTTITVGSGWSTASIETEQPMFNNCTKLVGWLGTTYNADHIDYNYARIDGGPNSQTPGYLTDINGVILTAKSYSREYGEANPSFEYTVEGATIHQTPTIVCDATETSPVGTYPINIYYNVGDTDWPLNIVCVAGSITITKAPLKVEARSYTIKRGEAMPTFEIRYAGFKNNEDESVLRTKPTASTEAKSDSQPGTYQIVVSGGEAVNYELEYVNGMLTITDDIVVTANSYTRQYGEANPTFEYTSEGAILSGTPSITCVATATSPVGTYDIVIAKGGVTNSEVTYVNGTLTITKAPLTITAKSYSIKQGKDLPTLELEYSGFKNNETEAVFTARPTVSTNASKNSEPGTYAINVSGAEATNYEVTYVNGTLTITAKTETFDGDVLTVEEGGNIDDAFESMGGRDEAAKTIAAIIWNSTEPLTSEMLKGLDNPNMLIYVQSKKQAPKDRNNVVINGVAEYVKLTDTGTGNHNFYAPVEFVADSITYTREFKQETRKNVSRGWEGICLPFTVQTFTHESHGKIAPFGNSASNYHFWLHQFTEDGIVDAETIEANKPYIISMPNSNEYYEEFNQAGKVQFASADVTIPVTETMVILLGDSVEIVPTFQAVEKSASVYALNVSDSIISSFEGSIFVSNYREVKPFEVYTFHEPSRNEYFASRFITVSSLFGGDSDSTGIIDVMEKQNGEVVKVYSINGNLIKQGNRNEVMNSLPKGLYIIGNQKIMVK